MAKPLKIKEKIIWDLWKSFEDKTIDTVEGQTIKIIDCGSLNKDLAGPDFRNVKIVLGTLTFVGDVEIDNDISDWKNHGHDIDNNYNKVILHVSFSNSNNQICVYSRNGRKIPTLKISDYISNEVLKETLKEYDDDETFETEELLKCSSSNGKVEHSIKSDFVLNLGMQRFEKKTQLILRRLKELTFLKELNLKEPKISYDLTPEFHQKSFTFENFRHKELWEQLFYELLMEALGYTNNKQSMNKLAQYASIKVIRDYYLVEPTRIMIESVLFGVAGLLPESEEKEDEVLSEYSKTLSLKWIGNRHLYDGEIMENTQWHFFRIRPQNFPTIRIAAAAFFVEEIIKQDFLGILLQKISEINKPDVLIKSLQSLFVVKSYGYWKHHYVFDKKSENSIKYFVGISRVDDIIINVILPFASLYFSIFGKDNIVKKIIKIYNVYNQKSENSILNIVSKGLKMQEEASKGIYAQGMIELYRNYCTKNRCLDCEIGKIAFN